MEGQFKVIENTSVDNATKELNDLLVTNYVKITGVCSNAKTIVHTLYLKARKLVDNTSIKES